MFNFIKNSYLFLVIFLLILFKEPIYKIINVKENAYTPIKCEFLESDYNKLLEFNNIDIIYDSTYINSYIIYKDIYDYMKVITIRGGFDKGFGTNAVIYDNTLVGVISKVNNNSSIVKLITNNSSKISVKINDSIGVLEYIDGKLQVNNISNHNNVSVGDQIYTSGLGNIHENIYIGTVKNITSKNNGIEESIEVDYRLDIKDIDYVTVMGVIK